MSFISSLTVDAQLLKSLLTPDLTLSVGRELAVRVASTDEQGRGVISLAGELLEAELPEGVQAGDELKLVVRDLSPNQVTLAVQPDTQTPVASFGLAPASASPTAELPPQSLAVREQPKQSQAPDGSTRHTLAITYQAPKLGPVDLQFVMDGSSLTLAVTLAPGRGFETAERSATVLQQAVSEASERPATVTITPRREPIEVFA